MPKPICGTCNIERRIGSHGGENGVEVVLMAGQRKDKAYSSDKWVCPICGNIEYHIARDTNPFWTEFSARPAPDAIPIWETIKDAQANLKPSLTMWLMSETVVCWLLKVRSLRPEPLSRSIWVIFWNPVG